jgi:outer membrane lipoprotein LolB
MHVSVPLSYYKQIIIAIIMLAIFSLTSCTQSNLNIVPEPQKQAVWEMNKKNSLKLKQSYNWTLLARVGLVSTQGSSSSQLDWVNQNNNYNITLNNAVTYGTIIINKNKNNVRLEYQSKIYQAKTSDELLYKLTNLKLPIAQLEYWILGLPSPTLAIDHIILNDYAMLENIKQGGYNITYNDYNLTNNYLLPNRITITAPGLHIKIIVQSWQV